MKTYEVSEREDMKFDYTKLWKLLESRNMYREDLRIETGMSSAKLAKLGKNEAVSMNVLGRICKALNCDIGDIVSYINEVENVNTKTTKKSSKRVC